LAVDTHTFSLIIGTVAIIIPALSLTISLILGALQSYYDPIEQTISQLVYYHYGWLQIIDFVVLSVWIVVFAVKFYSELNHRLTTKIAVLTFILTGIGFLLITIFPTHYPGSEKTLQSFVHERVAQSICILFPISCSLLIPEFRANLYWRRLSAYNIVTAITGLVLIIGGVTIMLTDLPFLGILERLIMLNAVIWLGIVGGCMLPQRFDNRNKYKSLDPVLRRSQQIAR
jgi:hypothetical protein